MNTFEVDKDIANIAHSFNEEVGISGRKNIYILNSLTEYESDPSQRNFNLEIEFELMKYNSKLLENLLGCYVENKATERESTKIKMLKFFDFTLHEFKRLRTKFEEINDVYFSLDYEYKCVNNIKEFMQCEEFKPTKMGLFYLKLLNHFLVKAAKKLSQFKEIKFNPIEKDKSKFIFINNKIRHLCIVVGCFLIEKKNQGNLESLLLPENERTWKELIKKILNDLRKFEGRNIFDLIKSGFTSVIDMLSFKNKGLKIFLEAVETKSHLLNEECLTNEVFYMPIQHETNFQIITEKKITQLTNADNYIKLRLITNQIVKVNYNQQNLLDKNTHYRDVTFFGLLLKVSRDYLTPIYNVILHISGGGFLSQSSESHISYLSKWAKESGCVIISLDFKLTSNNKYPILFDECCKIHETILKYSHKLFNFHINKLIIYSDTVGSLMAFDLIKHSIVENIKVPDACLCVFPYPKLTLEDEQLEKYEFLSYLEIDPNVITRIHDEFLLGNVNKKDNRINFLLTEGKIIEKFPNTLILSPCNEPIKEGCLELNEFLVCNKVKVDFKQLLYYCNGLFKIPTLFDWQIEKTLEHCFTYIMNCFNDEKDTISSKSSIGAPSNSTEV